ncbi:MULTISPECIES: hypothetical protein [Pseudomonas]|uniref:Uncharacterized protein n=1 Tax=Pseudomonas quebecensis TaxID=2995174 RepID=A0ABY6QM96_9PSED|nr:MULTISPECIES: hypothetical protein [Pseudomonas]MCP1511528.1 hypothetical protein [Pseudomonas rhodesiae]MCX4065703.1 hypothetical protein [Pseudomonas quebecensis]MDF9770353.1 hypothetical protein [Pseudomonas rhodesiae]UZW20601.1 hypothetical protein OSC50_09775 [Pseudomonas quebecensis]UZW21981.1 hypothetical protein OSC48_15705 [Pseudomonas quebecensis]
MNTDEKMTGDLFEVDKRLSLKPVVEFNAYLRSAFGDGLCTCIRCTASGGDENGYEFQHTFGFDGKPTHRRFASTAGSDVLQALKKAWLSYTKAELPASGVLALDTVKEFVEPQLHKRLAPLFLASGLASEVDGHLNLLPQLA